MNPGIIAFQERQRERMKRAERERATRPGNKPEPLPPALRGLGIDRAFCLTRSAT